jgi:formate hydrogenlyase subunit 6/NADH:ubiquinone oxidoreductase subunit I
MVGTSYKYGNMFRGMHRITTDFPMAPTHPYDAGIARFCQTCKTCAESCPWDAMPLGDASWEHEEAEEEELKNYTPGFKGWRLFNLKCIRCKNCHTQCPFNSYDTAITHGLVRATAATVQSSMASWPICTGPSVTEPRTLSISGNKVKICPWEDSTPNGLSKA